MEFGDTRKPAHGPKGGVYIHHFRKVKTIYVVKLSYD